VKQIRIASRPAHVRVNLHIEVASRIGSLIAQEKLLPGSTLPNETLLGAEFGVSRTALREAIKVLASKGLVDVRRKTGTRVNSHANWNMLDPEVLSWIFSGEGVSARLFDLIQVRMLIEPPASRMAANKANIEDLKDIRTNLERMEASTGNLRSSVEADLAFHMAILEGTHNAFMRPFGALIEATLRGSFRLTSSDADLYRLTLPLHRRILEALEEHDGDKAERAMKILLTQTQHDIDEQTKALQKKSPSSKRRSHRSS
jgi:DNA-binding FadR family transcriptional regulator